MTSKSSATIYGIGSYLPEEVRTNDWWPERTAATWRRLARMMANAQVDEASLPPGAHLVRAALLRFEDDPFQGARERRVMQPGQVASDLELVAATKALDAAGVSRDEVDLLITYSSTPDFIGSPNSAVLHHRLGLEERCLSFSIEGACNSFLQQMTIAEQMIRGGAARRALLVQSCTTLSTTLPMGEAYAAWFGDGASAVVVGPAREGYGLLGRGHRTLGAFSKTLVNGVRGKRWWEEGAVELYSEDVPGNRQMLLSLPSWCEAVLGEAFAEAGVGPEDVDFYASHQGTAWFRDVTQAHVGMRQARSLDTFASFGSLSAANIPTVLSLATHEGSVREGDVVAMHAGGTGVTTSGLVMRWGGRADTP